MKLNIKQIESILPSVCDLYNLVEAYNKFQSIGYEKHCGKDGMVSFGVVLQNMQAQAKHCYNYNEINFVKQFNEGVLLIAKFAAHMNWHFPIFINEELKMLIQGVLYEEE